MAIPGRSRRFLLPALLVVAVAATLAVLLLDGGSGPDDSAATAELPAAAGGAIRAARPDPGAGAAAVDPERAALDGPPPAESATGAPVARTGRLLTGRLVDESGVPVIAATLELCRATGGFLPVVEPLAVFAESSGIGGFRFQEPPAEESLALLIHARGKARTLHGPVVARADESTDLGDIVLKAGFTLSGRVESNANLAPLSGARVVAEALGPAGATVVLGKQHLEGLANDYGRYEIHGLAHGRYRIRAAAAGFAERVIERAFLLARHQESIQQDLALEPAVLERTGVVLDADGEPVGGASVLARLPGGGAAGEPEHAVESRSAADGSFTLSGLTLGDYEVVAAKAGYSCARPALLAAAGGDCVVRLERTGAISGRVRLWSGRIPDGFEIAVLREAGGPERLVPVGPARRGRDPGTFEATGLPAGRYHLDASAPGGAPRRAGPVELEAGAAVAGVEVVLPEGAELSGRLARIAGGPLGGARISLLPDGLSAASDLAEALLVTPMFQVAAETAADGSFRLAHVPEGSHILRILTADGGTALVRGLHAEEGLRIDLGVIEAGGAGRLAGSVLLDDGRPAAGARVVAYCEENLIRRSAVAGAGGTFEFVALPEGDYEIKAKVPGRLDSYRFHAGATAHVAADATSEVRLEVRDRP